jgi:hypothetical protein
MSDNTIDFNARRGVNPEDFADVDDYIDAKMAENDSFRGHDLNREKLDKLNRLRVLCAKAAEIDDRIKNIPFPFSNASRHGVLTLELPYIYGTGDAHIRAILSALYKETNDFTIAYTEDGKIRLSFSVLDMWDTWSID